MMDAAKWRYNMIRVQVKLRNFSRALSNRVLNRFLCRIFLIVLVFIIFLGMNYVFYEGIETFSVAKNPLFNYIRVQHIDNVEYEAEPAKRKKKKTSRRIKFREPTKTIAIEVRSSRSQVYVKVDDYKAYENNGPMGRGIHAIVINQFTGIVMSTRIYDTCGLGNDYENLREFLANVQDGRIIVFSVQDEASFAFPKIERKFLKDLGSRKIDDVDWRIMWIYVCVKKIDGFVDEVITEDDKDPVNPEFGKPLFMKVEVKLQPKENDCDWINFPTNIRHAQFCSRRAGYGDLCRCDNPLDIDLKATPLLGSRLNSVPITVLAAYRPNYLNRMLRNLLVTSGVTREMITIYIDGYNDEISDLSNMYSLKYIEHKPACNRSVCRISQHCKRSFHETFEAHPNAKYAIILEEDLYVAEDIMDYFSQLLPMLEEDDTIYCISAWNDNSYPNSCNDPSMLYRVETMPGLGWVLKRKLFKDELEPVWPGIDYPSDWDIWTRGRVRKGRECIIPDVPRTFHFGAGVHVDIQGQKKYYAKKVLNHQTGIRFDRTKMTLDEYEKEINDLVQTAHVVNHSKIPCVHPDFIPNTRAKVYIVYIKCTYVEDCSTWFGIARCYKIWDVNVRGFHKGMWRLWLKENHVIFVSNLSPYYIHKPREITPLYIAPKRKE